MFVSKILCCFWGHVDLKADQVLSIWSKTVYLTPPKTLGRCDSDICMNVLYSDSPYKNLSGRYICVIVPVRWFVLATVLRKVGHTTENTDVVYTSLLSTKKIRAGLQQGFGAKIIYVSPWIVFHINPLFFPSFFTLNEHDQINKICVGAYISARILRQY